jgi:hypothetical protein
VLKKLNHTPSFEGRHNYVKAVVWLILIEQYTGGKKGLTLKELSSVTGFGYKSLSVLLGRWARWNYVGVQYHNYSKGRRYYLKKRGRNWIERWWDYLPVTAGQKGRINNAP